MQGVSTKGKERTEQVASKNTQVAGRGCRKASQEGLTAVEAIVLTLEEGIGDLGGRREGGGRERGAGRGGDRGNQENKERKQVIRLAYKGWS